MKKNFILLDIETTGLSPNSCEITEIGAIKVDGNTLEIIDTFETFIDIKGDVSYFITSLTGITKSMLTNKGIKIDQALNKLIEFCGDLDIYAHNSNFDKRFIRHYLKENNSKYIETNWIDTIRIFRNNNLSNCNTYKLEHLIRQYNLAEKEEHRAISDATFTLELLKKCKWD